MEKMLGVMLDCSRNAVLKPEMVKKYASLIRKMGYNTLMLYTEDTYEVNNQPLFGHLRGRYSKAEIKELDAYCASIGLELVPCIQTLAHLENMFRWKVCYGDINDCDDILLAGDEKTYALIEDMISTLAECFTTRKIHIGMDEAYRVGTGKYLDIHGARDRFDVINEHLGRVCEIAGKYGFEPMIWSDMFTKLALKQENQYAEVNTDGILEKSALPEKISLVYWDYYSADVERYRRMLRTNKLFGRKVYFAGGAWTWKGFAPDNALSIRATTAALQACREEGCDGMFFTVWGDDGGECSKFAVLPALLYAAELSRGNGDMDSIREKFRELVDCEFDDLTLLDGFDALGGEHKGKVSKYLLYADPFMGTRDHRVKGFENAHYAALAEKLRGLSHKGEFSYLFASYEEFAKVLSLKAELGVRTRKAYLEKDADGLRAAAADMDRIILSLQNFHKAFRTLWFRENKPQGFEVQDIRLGGLMQRLATCRERLEQYLSGEIERIEELEEPVLDVIPAKTQWQSFVSVGNVIC